MPTSKSPNPPHSPSSSSGQALVQSKSKTAQLSSPRVSEPMRRIQALLQADKLSTSDVVDFSYRSLTFTANILPDGSLKPRPSSSLPRNSPLADKIYSSPSDFATDMAISTQDASQKSRTNIEINGWNECHVSGRSLNILHVEMLREKSANSLSVKQSKNDEVHHPLRSIRPSDHVRSLHMPRPSSFTDKPSKSTTLEKHQDSRRRTPGASSAQDSKSADQSQSPSETRKTSSSKTPLTSPIAQREISGNEKKKSQVDRPKPREVDEQQQPKIDESNRDRKFGKEKNILKSDIVDGKKSDGFYNADDPQENVNGPKTSSPSELNSKGDFRGSDSIEPLAKRKPDSAYADKNSFRSRLPPHDDGAKPSREESKENKDHERDSGDGNRILSESDDDSAKEDSISNEISESHPVGQAHIHRTASKKRKRHEAISPRTEGTPERLTKPRRDNSRLEGRIDAPSTLQDLPPDLDPETMEAAAIAEQAEKEEASRRGRRTTRLASGKIKQVDYKASNNPLNARGLSPGHDHDEGDSNSNHGHDTTSGETGRQSRRRVTTQSHSSGPSRSSKRVALMRSSHGPYDNESGDEELGRWAGSGKGSEESDDKSGRGDEVSEDDIEMGDLNKPEENSRSESLSRKKSKTSSGSVESSDNEDHSARGQIDGQRVHAGGKPSKECIMELSMEKRQREEVLEHRRDAMGWTIRELISIGKAVKECYSSDAVKVARVLSNRKDWTENETGRVQSYVERATAAIEKVTHEMSGVMESRDDGVRLLLAFITADIHRLESGGLKTGYPRRPLAILDHGFSEDQQRVTTLKDVKKIQRESDEVRAKLEAEMESRRKAEMDMDIADVLLRQVNFFRERVNDRTQDLKAELDWLDRRESKTLGLVEDTKNLFARLRGEKDGAAENAEKTKKVEVLVGEEDDRPRTKGQGLTSQQGPSGRNVRESWDDDANVVIKKAEKRTRRRQAMERLRWLIATKEAESEAYQRLCEKERSRLFNLLEVKSRLETEVYNLGLKAGSGSAGGPGGSTVVSSIVNVTLKTGKDGSRKGETRTVLTSNHGRGVGSRVGKPTSATKTGAVSTNTLADDVGSAVVSSSCVGASSGVDVPTNTVGNGNNNANNTSGVANSGGGGGPPWSRDKLNKDGKPVNDSSKYVKRKNGSGKTNTNGSTKGTQPP